MLNFRSRANTTTRRRVLASLFLAIVASVAGGCCLEVYHIGPQGLYNMEIRSVYVPMIEANTYRQDFGERLTEAIVKKISEQTPYRIANAKDADSVLTVKLTGETQTVSALNRYDDTRQKNVELTATAVWTDVRGVASPNQSPNDALSKQSGATILSQSFLVPEMGQSTATAQQEAIDKLADRIVGLMETAW